MTRFVPFVLIVSFGSACASAAARMKPDDAVPRIDLGGFNRVLVAGFVARRTDRVDVNEETTRFLRTELRWKGGVDVIEIQPLQLDSAKTSETVDHGIAEDAFRDKPFWRRVGEEYGQPLIVTGTATFAEVGPKFHERLIGARTVRVWRRGYGLQLHLVFISGSTGEIIGSVTLARRYSWAVMGRESALSLYYKLMDQTMPSIIEIFRRQRPSRVRTP